MQTMGPRKLKLVCLNERIQYFFSKGPCKVNNHLYSLLFSFSAFMCLLSLNGIVDT